MICKASLLYIARGQPVFSFRARFKGARANVRLLAMCVRAVMQLHVRSAVEFEWRTDEFRRQEAAPLASNVESKCIHVYVSVLLCPSHHLNPNHRVIRTQRKKSCGSDGGSGRRVFRFVGRVMKLVIYFQWIWYLQMWYSLVLPRHLYSPLWRLPFQWF